MKYFILLYLLLLSVSTHAEITPKATQVADNFHHQSDKTVTAKNNRILLKIPFEDRENLLHVMRNNLKNLGRMIDAMANNDFDEVKKIAGNMSFNRKKGKGLSHRGNTAFIAMGVKFHAVDTIAVMKSAETKDRNATLHAMSSMINTCVACHTTFRVSEWPDNKHYKRPEARKLYLPQGFKVKN